MGSLASPLSASKYDALGHWWTLQQFLLSVALNAHPFHVQTRMNSLRGKLLHLGQGHSYWQAGEQSTGTLCGRALCAWRWISQSHRFQTYNEPTWYTANEIHLKCHLLQIGLTRCHLRVMSVATGNSLGALKIALNADLIRISVHILRKFI